jgi:site-specific DNA-adenine methylase
MRYIGGKNQAGTWKRIVALFPPHRVYIEPFLGSGAVLRGKRPAAVSIGVDLATPNPALIELCDFHKGDGISFLERYKFRGDELVYADPPYMLSTRGGRRYYRHEMEDADHVRLLRVLKKIKAHVVVSGYPSALYDEALSGWSRETFTAYTRNHQKRTEVLWFNFQRPAVLHDWKCAGADFRERWRIEKKRRRWAAKIKAMPERERLALFSALVDAVGKTAAAIAIGGAAAG